MTSDPPNASPIATAPASEPGPPPAGDRSVPLVGVVLAGGGSRRMGGRAKGGLVDAHGRTLADHVAGGLATWCDRVIVAGPAGTCAGRAHVADRHAGRGPLAGLHAAALAETAADLLACPCDLPLAAVDADGPIARLARIPGPATAAVRVRGRDAAEPMPLRLAAGLGPLLEEVLGEARPSVRRLLERLADRLVEVRLESPEALANLNTPEDAAALGWRWPEG